MKRVLITGYRGFTGQYLAARLREEGAEVYGLVQKKSDDAMEFCCDLRCVADVREVVLAVKPSHVVHLAAISFVAHGDIRAFYDVNLFGTLNLLEAIGALGTVPERVLIASSANVYGAPRVEVVDEQQCPLPINHYGNSKLAMENMVRNWMERMSIVIARPFNYTGIGQDERFLIPKIVAHLKRRVAVLQLGNMDIARDFSDVRDVAKAYARLLDDEGAAGQTVNICSGIAYKLREVLELACEFAGYRPEVRVDSGLIRSNEIKRLVGDYGRLRKLTGFVPSISMTETLRWMLKA